MALDRKLDALMALGPDVAVVPEAGHPDRVPIGSTPSVSYDWIGRSRSKGLGVVCRQPWHMERLRPEPASIEWVLPLRIAGPQGEFALLAVWAMNHRAANRSPDDRQLDHALDEYADDLAGLPLVVAGDFNNSTVFDRRTRRGERTFAESVAPLTERGLASVYHLTRNVAFGDEPEPTLYWQTQRPGGRVYHVDYCFLPEKWAQTARVTVGAYDAWIRNRLSDHAPVIVEFSTESPTQGSPVPRV
jgi:hypothetical protein